MLVSIVMFGMLLSLLATKLCLTTFRSEDPHSPLEDVKVAYLFQRRSASPAVWAFA